MGASATEHRSYYIAGGQTVEPLLLCWETKNAKEAILSKKCKRKGRQTVKSLKDLFETFMRAKVSSIMNHIQIMHMIFL